MKLNLALLVILAASLGANFGIRDNPGRRNFEVMPEMVHSAAYKSFTANPNFADGKTLQLPPEGTVARGARPPRPAASAAMVNQGARTYQVYCLSCHGGSGKGDGPVAQRGFPPPPSFFADRAMHLTDDEIFQIITRGQKNMPAYAAQVAPEERWRVIAYVRSLQGAKKP